jgi:hypothetical protein
MTYFVLVFTTFNFFTNTPEVHSVDYRFNTYEACRIARFIKTDDPTKIILKAECQEREDNG